MGGETKIKMGNNQSGELTSDQRAMKLLNREVGTGLMDYANIVDVGLIGYTQVYLTKTVDFDACSTRAKKDVLIELAKVDLEMGTDLASIVYYTCGMAPLNEIIKELVELETGDTMQVKMQKILQFEDKVGHNTLLACFGMLSHDTKKEN